jgi:2-dehydropantoate 2-reductase
MEVRQPDRGSRADVTVAILGPGAVGGVLAAGFLDGGLRVLCIARPDTAAVIRSEGLTLRQGLNVRVVRPEVATELREPVELLLVTVKAPAVEDALDRLQAPAVTVIPLLNGIEHMESLRRRLPESAVIAGNIGRIEAYLERPGVVIKPTPSVEMTVASDASDAAVELLRRSGVEVRVGGSGVAVLWEKLARQAAVAAATASSQRPIGELRSDPEWRPTLQQAIHEACAVAAADGVTLSPDAEWEIIEAMPPLLTSSTARDIAAGRPSELDAITGAAVRAGRRLGVATPVLDRLLAEAEEACRALSR